MMLIASLKTTCCKCGESFLYEFSSEKVRNYGIPSIEDIQPGEIFFGIISVVICKNCGRRMQVSNFKHARKREQIEEQRIKRYKPP